MGFLTNLRQAFGFNVKESRTAGLISSPGVGGVIWPNVNYQNFADETYLKNVIAFKAIDEVAKNVAIPPWRHYRRNGDGRELLEGTDIDKILKRPNKDESFSFLMLKASAFYSMAGNSFFERVSLETGPNKGIPKELYVLRPDRFEFITEEHTGRFVGYRYKVNGREVSWICDPITGQCDILHLKTFHPTDDWWGAAATQSAAREIDTGNAATQWNKSILDNEARPGMIFTLVGAGIDQMDELEAQLQERNSGPENAGRNLIIAGEDGTSATPYGWSPKDLDFNEGDLRLCRKIAIAYGVPPMLLGIPGEATFANYKEARLAFWESTVTHQLSLFRDEFNNWLFGLDSDEFIDYDLTKVPAIMEKQEILWTRAEKATHLSVNEKREMTGLESWGTSGDVILVSASMIPLESLSQDDDEGVEDEDEDEETRSGLRSQGYDDDDIDEMLGLKNIDTSK